MNTLLKKNRLVLALTAGFLALALQGAGAAWAFAGGGAARADIVQLAPGGTSHDTTNWAGNVATASTQGTYRVAFAEFTVPTLNLSTSHIGDQVSFWTGLGGNFGGSELVQAGIDSYVNSSGRQVNNAWYEWVGLTASTTISPQPISFPGGLSHGDEIEVTVYSDYQDRGVDSFYFTNETTGQSPTPVRLSNKPLSDGKSGECIGERVSGIPVADFGTNSFSECKITDHNGTTHAVGNGWPTTWYHIVDSTLDILVSTGSLDSSGGFPLTWHARD